jgi:hypothetical protein
MARIDKLWETAEAALAQANTMPWGPERLEALRKAALLRNNAVLVEIELGQFRKIRPAGE